MHSHQHLLGQAANKEIEVALNSRGDSNKLEQDSLQHRSDSVRKDPPPPPGSYFVASFEEPISSLSE